MMKYFSAFRGHFRNGSNLKLSPVHIGKYSCYFIAIKYSILFISMSIKIIRECIFTILGADQNKER